MKILSKTLFASLLLLVLGCQEGQVVPMPPELVGVWRTEAEDYRACYLEISALQVRFGVDEKTVSAHEITEVRELPGGNREFRISYLTASDGQGWLSLKYAPNSEILRLANQPQMSWLRTPGSPG